MKNNIRKAKKSPIKKSRKKLSSGCNVAAKNEVHQRSHHKSHHNSNPRSRRSSHDWSLHLAPLSEIELHSAPLILIDCEQRIKMCNQSYYAKFQVGKLETEGWLFAEVQNGLWNIPALKSLIQATLDGREKLDGFEVEHDSLEFGYKCFLLSSKLIPSAGSPEQLIILSIEDFTEKRRLERRLRASEENYRKLILATCDGIVVVSSSGNISFGNKSFGNMFGYELDELKNLPFENLVDVKYRKTISLYHSRFFRKPIRRDANVGLKISGRRKDGTVFPIDALLSSFESDSEALVTWVVRDISKFSEIENQRLNLIDKERQARVEAEYVNQVKDDFLATLSHELRTPLTNIIGWTQELLKSEVITGLLKEGVEVIERSAEVQAQLINDLLDVSRITAGKITLDVKPVEMTSLLNSVLSLAKKQAESKGICIEKIDSGEEFWINADACRVQQIFWNLIANSIKFTPKSGKISVNVGAVESATGELVQIQVKDSGIGIKSEFLPHIFERFRQADSSMSRMYSGLGLGLAIVESLVKMQVGTVKAESDGEGKGATFTVQFPAINQVKSSVVECSLSKKAKSNLDLHGIKVLVVDDNADTRVLFSIILKNFGADVCTAESVSEGLKMINEFKPDIVLSDISMPGEDGYSFIRKVRLEGAKDPRGNLLKIVALTAYVGESDVRRILSEGFAAHIAKPVNRTELSEVIVNLIK